MTPEQHQWLSNFGCNVREMFGAYHKEDNGDLHKRAFVTNAADADYHSLEMHEFEHDGKTIRMNVPKGRRASPVRHDVDNGHLP